MKTQVLSPRSTCVRTIILYIQYNPIAYMFVIYKYNVHFINKIPCFHDETFGHKHKKSRPIRILHAIV
jgi:hypothetical protein